MEHFKKILNKGKKLRSSSGSTFKQKKQSSSFSRLSKQGTPSPPPPPPSSSPPKTPSPPLSPYFPNIPLNKFSLIQLSIFIRILRKIGIDKLKNNSKTKLLQIIKSNAINVIKELNYYFSDRIVEEIFNKLDQIIFYYNTLINTCRDEIFDSFEHLGGNKLNFIEARVKDFYLTMKPDDFKNFLLKNHIMPFRLSMSEVMKIVRGLNNDNLNKLFTSVSIVQPLDFNIFTLWHLFVAARILIRLFIESCLNGEYYNQLYNEINFGNQLISFRSYIEAYDEFELKANQLYNIMKDLSFLKKKNVEFNGNVNFEEENTDSDDEDNLITRQNMLISLQEAESGNDISIYKVNYYREDFRQYYFPLIYTYILLPNISPTYECQELANALNNYIYFYPLNNYIYFYPFFNSLSNQLKLKLEANIINNYLLDEIKQENEGIIQKVYLEQNIIEYIKINEIEFLPQPKGRLIEAIKNYCGFMRE